MSDQENEDQQDALSFSFRKQRPSQLPVPRRPVTVEDHAPIIIPAIDDDYYKMNHKNRGIALIFNHYEFVKPGYPAREGTDKDCKEITKTLKKLGFEIIVHNDLKLGRIEEVLDDVSRMNHSENDCLVVVVMTHGDPDILHAQDEAYYASALWDPFTGDKCPTLIGKPKLFFIQACRGTGTDDGVDCNIQFDSAPVIKPVQIKIPKMADFMVMYATPLGNYSFRSPQNGSWFIQSLSRELGERAMTDDLNMILTRVNRKMALNYASNVPSSRDLHNKKQVGQIVSSLTRLVHFNRSIPNISE